VPESPTIADLFAGVALISYEHQMHMIEVIGDSDHRWDAKFDAPPRLVFTTPDREIVSTRFHLLGSAAPGPKSWLWSWANPTDYPAEITALAEGVRLFGEQHQIPELADGEVMFRQFPDEPTESIRVAWLVGELAKAVSGQYTLYLGNAAGGTRIAMLVEHPEFVLPAPTGASVLRVIQEGLMGLGLPDHWRVLRGYVARRGLSATFAGDRELMLVRGPGINMTVLFDDIGRVARIQSTLEPGDPA
jgi:hypothetical protein